VTLTSVARVVQLQILGSAPAAIARDGATLTKFATAAEFDAADAGWIAGSPTGFISIKFQHSGGNTTIRF
jgi:hypothetical protein